MRDLGEARARVCGRHCEDSGSSRPAGRSKASRGDDAPRVGSAALSPELGRKLSKVRNSFSNAFCSAANFSRELNVGSAALPSTPLLAWSPRSHPFTPWGGGSARRSVPMPCLLDKFPSARPQSRVPAPASRPKSFGPRPILRFCPACLSLSRSWRPPQPCSCPALILPL